MPYFTYIVCCADGTFYTGITTDLERRLYEHNHTDKGAKYTRARRPIKLIHSETFENRSEASKREYALKKMKKDKKKEIVGSDGSIFE